MNLTVKCLKCKEKFSASETMCGQEINCPHCNARLLLPKETNNKSPTITNKKNLATWSLILGLTSFLCSLFTAIPAVICGHISLSQIKKSNGLIPGKEKALTGVICGYIAMGLFLIIIILPDNTSTPNKISQNGKSTKKEEVLDIANAYLKIVLTHTDTFLCNAYMKPNKNNITAFMPIDKNNVRDSIWDFIKTDYNNYTYQTKVEMLNSFEETYYNQLNSFQKRWEILKSNYGSNLTLGNMIKSKKFNDHDVVTFEVLNGRKQINLFSLGNSSALFAALDKHPEIELIKYQNEWIPLFPGQW